LRAGFFFVSVRFGFLTFGTCAPFLNIEYEFIAASYINPRFWNDLFFSTGHPLRVFKACGSRLGFALANDTDSAATYQLTLLNPAGRPKWWVPELPRTGRHHLRIAGANASSWPD
jgi:hypothetical protein